MTMMNVADISSSVCVHGTIVSGGTFDTATIGKRIVHRSFREKRLEKIYGACVFYV